MSLPSLAVRRPVTTLMLLASILVLGGVASQRLKLSFLPDLVIIDGGKGQLGRAVSVLEKFDLQDKIPIVGLAKQREEIFFPHRSEPLMLPRHSQALYLVQRIRDEAHRYGITAHRKKRQKLGMASQLDSIPGIGAHLESLIHFDIRTFRREHHNGKLFPLGAPPQKLKQIQSTDFRHIEIQNQECGTFAH